MKALLLLPALAGGLFLTACETVEVHHSSYRSHRPPAVVYTERDYGHRYDDRRYDHHYDHHNDHRYSDRPNVTVYGAPAARVYPRQSQTTTYRPVVIQPQVTIETSKNKKKKHHDHD